MKLKRKRRKRLIDIESIRVVETKPGDKIVFMCDEKLSAQSAERIRETIKKIFPINKVLVLGEGMRIEVVRDGARDGSYDLR